MKIRYKGWLLGVCVLGAAGAWQVWRADAPAAGAAPAARGARSGPAPVSLAIASRQDVALEVQVNGTVAPLRTVELRAQTSSLLKQVHIREGQFVQAGQLLFTLDERSERANVDKAQAQVARGRAALADLERQFKRSRELAAQQFISQGASETVQTQFEAQRAQLQSDQAALEAARVALGYATIRAPMAGRVGAINVFPGSLVQPALVLASVTQIDPISVSFTLPEGHLPGLLERYQRAPVAVTAALPQPGRTLTGTLSFIDSAVDPVAGTIRAKADFANRERALWPGQFVSTTVALGTLRDAVVVPLAAIVTTGAGKFVYAVDAGQNARMQAVTLLHAFGAQAAVSGLSGGERIVTEGKQNLRPGSKVAAAPAPAPALADAGGSVR